MCPVCRTALPLDAAPSAVYCSGACRHRAHRARRHGRLLEALHAAEEGRPSSEVADILRGLVSAP